MKLETQNYKTKFKRFFAYIYVLFLSKTLKTSEIFILDIERLSKY